MARFNGDINRAYDYYSEQYKKEASKLTSYKNRINDLNNKIIKDTSLLSKTNDLAERDKITSRLDYNKNELLRYSSKIDGAKKNCKKYNSILDSLGKIRKSSLKNEILKNTKKAIGKTLEVGKKAATTAAKTTVESAEAGVGAALDATADSMAAGATATGVGAPAGAGIKAARLAGKTSYKAASTSSKALVHAVDKTAMSASKALKESVKLTKIQNLILGADDPNEMVKTVGQKGINLAVSTFFMGFNFAIKNVIRILTSPILFLLTCIVVYIIILFVTISSLVTSSSTLISYLVNNKKEEAYEDSYGSGELLAEIAIEEYEASWETDSDGNQIKHLKESDGVQKKYIDKYNELANTSFGYGTSWCAIFVTYCCDKAGLIEDGSFAPMASCVSIMNYYIEKGLYHNISDDDYTPKPGDLAIHPGHVGIIVEVNDNEIVVISGNSSNTVGRSTYSNISKSSYTGYIEMPFKTIGIARGERIYLSDQELLDFAAVVAGEAGNDPDGTLAVATVIMHRYEGKGGYAGYRSIYEVTHARYQFSAVNDPIYNSIMSGQTDISAYPNAYKAAQEAMKGVRSGLIPEDCVSFKTDWEFYRSQYPNGVSIGGNWFHW